MNKHIYCFLLVLYFCFSTNIAFLQTSGCDGEFIDAGIYQSLCENPNGGTINLNGSASANVIGFVWSDNNGEIARDNLQVEGYFLSETTTVTLSGIVISDNQIIDGDFGTGDDFENGFPSNYQGEFFTDYVIGPFPDFPPPPPPDPDNPMPDRGDAGYVSPLEDDGSYMVTDDSFNGGIGFIDCLEPSGNGGNMAVFNLGADRNKIICTKVQLTTGNEYTFSMQVATVGEVTYPDFGDPGGGPPSGGDAENDPNGDIDGDGFPNGQDCCPYAVSSAAEDCTPCAGTNSDDPDTDGDGIPDSRDNCPFVPNPAQDPADCSTDDRDNDGIPDWQDNCPEVSNPSQEDRDGNGVGDDCEEDSGTGGGPGGGFGEYCIPFLELELQGTNNQNTVIGLRHESELEFCVWTDMVRTFTAETSGEIEICIMSACNYAGGNLLAIDNLQFSETCRFSDEVTIHVDNITANILPVEPLDCNTEGVLLEGEWGAIYEDINSIEFFWFEADQNVLIPGASNEDYYVEDPGTFNFSVLNEESGCFAVFPMEVADNFSNPEAIIALPDTISCVNEIIILDATASAGGADDSSYTYQWNGVFGAEFLNGNPEDNSPTQEVIGSGTYELLITNTFNGCTSETFIFVEENLQTVNLNSPQTTYELGCDVASVEFDVEAEIDPDTEPIDIEYVWSYNGEVLSTSSTIASLSANQSGTYELIVTNQASGCSDELTFNVTGEAAGPQVAVAEVNESISCDNTSVEISATIDNTNNITYTWTNSAGDIISANGALSLEVITADSYTFTATDDVSGCESSETVIVAGNSDEPDFSIAIPEAFDCRTNQINLMGIPSDPSGNYEYQWTNSQNQILGSQLTLEVYDAGQYTLQVKDLNNGCPREVSINVFDLSAQPQVSLMQSQIINCNSSSAEIILNSGDDNLLYAWGTGDGNITAENGNVISINSAGTYMITVTDDDTGCTVETSLLAESNFTSPNFQAGTPTMITCDNEIATVFIDDFGAGYNYQWTSLNSGNIMAGANTNSPSFDMAGDFSLTITNPASGCTEILPFTIEGNSTVPALSIVGGGQLDCDDESLPISVSLLNSVPNVSVSWRSENGGTFNGSTNELTTLASTAGIYQVIVTNEDNGCTAEAQIEVTQDNDRPTINLPQPPDLDCINQSVSLDASGSNNTPNVQIQWVAVNGSAISNSTDLNPTVSDPDTYTLTITNPDNGCSASASVTIEENDDLPVVDIPSQLELSCDSPTLSVGGGASSTGNEYSYQWLDQSMNPITGQNNIILEIAEAGTYTLQITNNETGCEESSTVVVSGNSDLPDVNAGNSVQLNCNQASDFLAGSAPADATYLWTAADGGSIIAGANSLTPEINAPGIYTLTVNVASTGCEASSSVVVEQDTDTPVIEIVTPETLSCINNTISIDATGSTNNNVNIEWVSADNNLISNANSLNVEVSMPGEYSLILTNDDSGCTTEQSITIEENNIEPEVILAQNIDLDCLEPNTTIGAIDNPDFDYEWSLVGGTIQGTNTVSEIEVNEAGVYMLLVTDPVNGCQSEYTVNVTADFESTNIVSLDADMINCTNKTVIPALSIDGDNSDVSFSWSTINGVIDEGANSTNPTFSQAGEYQVEVTNLASGCITSQSIMIEEDTNSPSFNLGPDADLTCGGSSFEIGLDPASQNTSYEYTWRDGQGNIFESSAQIEITNPGTYQLEIVDTSNGCSTIDEIVIDENINAPEIEAGDNLEFLCGDTQLNLEGAIISNVSNFEINWLTNNGNIDSGANTLQPTITQPGTYIFELTNLDNQCVATAEVLVTPDTEAPNAIIDPASDLNCNVSSVTLNGDNSTGNSSNLNFTWYRNGALIVEGVQQIEVNSEGAYDLIVLDMDNNCSTTTSVVISEDTSVPQISILPTLNLDCDIKELSLEADYDSNNLTFSWTTIDGNIVEKEDAPSPIINAPGEYILTVSDAQTGCTNSASINVEQDGDVPVFNLSNDGFISCDNQVSTIDANIPNGNFELIWTDLSTNSTIMNSSSTLEVNEPGIYQLEVIDQNNLCNSIKTIEIEENVLAPELDALQPLAINCDNTSTSINAQITNNISNYEINWSTIGGEIESTNLNSFDIDVLSGGTYIMVVTNTDNGCENTLSIEVPENGDIPTFDFEEANNITCLSTEVELVANIDNPTPNTILTWTFENGDEVGDGESIIVDSEGSYTLRVEDAESGCFDEQSISVGLDTDEPLVGIGIPSTLNCTVLETGIVANVDNANNIIVNWTTVGGNFSGPTNTLNTTVDKAGTYVINVSNIDNGCSTEEEVVVDQNIQTPTIEIDEPEELTCKIEIVQLAGTGQTIGNLESIWTDTNNGIVGNNLQENIEVNLPGVYTFTITDTENNCSNTASVTVIQNQNVPDGIDALVTPPLCFDELGSIDIVEVSGGTAPFNYSINGSPFDPTSDFDQLTPGSYSLAIIDEEECTYEQEFVVPEVPQLTVTTPADIQLLVGQSNDLQLNTSIPASQISSIKWEPSTYLSCDDCLNPTVKPNNDIIYFVTIENENGCTAFDSIAFRVQRKVGIYTPTAFSPNQDAINDYFTIYAQPGTVEQVSSLAIFDRWGNQVFHKENFPVNNELEGWNGTYRGESMRPGVFVFKATVLLSNGDFEQVNGDLNLIR